MKQKSKFLSKIKIQCILFFLCILTNVIQNKKSSWEKLRIIAVEQARCNYCVHFALWPEQVHQSSHCPIECIYQLLWCALTALSWGKCFSMVGHLVSNRAEVWEWAHFFLIRVFEGLCFGIKGAPNFLNCLPAIRDGQSRFSFLFCLIAQVENGSACGQHVTPKVPRHKSSFPFF